MSKIAQAMALAAATALTASVAFAAPPTSTAPTGHRAHLIGLFHPKKPLFAGNIIGNKRTHVYHMPGDPGALPAPQNRVYFHTQAQAIAAGFHRAGSHAAHGPVHPKHTLLIKHH